MTVSTSLFWQSYIRENNMPEIAVPEAWQFGDGTKAMGDELSALVVAGRKTATCSAYELYALEGERLPVVGQFDIVLNGDDEPVAIIETTKVEVKKMSDVTPEFSYAEGEGDLTHGYWYRVHEQFFTILLHHYNRPFSADILLICQYFKVVKIA
ncbi:ASCH domain-containing protein [Kurthia sibirica]|uniref:RNA-binding protein n=1 Tax=Kurthia sibirica TaxID=202750 RepID=A0A2U3AKK9_9BACL|nr:ASCH domain-containing protein [Kurthia sibirica]PWI25055.1 RNA-binding protein [Kurthia sibirica]GEK34220.1 RNA-binding protein [Kurthia sibirica]